MKNTEAHRREFLPIAEFGARIGVSRRTAYAMVEAGEVPVVKLRGQLRVPTRALEQWLADREAEALASVRSQDSP